jgi:hypothetical protein
MQLVGAELRAPLGHFGEDRPDPLGRRVAVAAGRNDRDGKNHCQAKKRASGS